MRKFILAVFILVLFFPLMVMGQDVIVKRDGSTIISKVLEVTPNSIKYKKQSNLNGPTYTIDLPDVLSVNYANGEKDMFDKPANTVVEADQKKDAQQNSIINDAIIGYYNDRSIKLNITKAPKKIEWVYRLLNIHQQSTLGNTDGRLYINIDHDINDEFKKAFLDISIENTTDVMMYVDLGNCTFRINKTASTFFVNSSTTQTSGSSGGANVNLGAVAHAFGIGGIVGSLASGVTVGGGHTSGSSTTIYADRIITIPPHSKYFFNRKIFYKPYIEKPYKTDFKFGDRFKYNQPANIKDTPWEIIVSYITEDEPNVVKRYSAGLYISEELSADKTWDKSIINETGVAPLHYFYRTKE